MHYIRPNQIEAVTGLSERRCRELEKLGKFPRRRRLSARACGWLSTEIEAWLEARPLADDVAPDVDHIGRDYNGATHKRVTS